MNMEAAYFIKLGAFGLLIQFHDKLDTLAFDFTEHLQVLKMFALVVTFFKQP